MADAGRAFQPAQLGNLTLKNRIMKAATFEGMTPDGKISDRLIEFQREIAEGGVGLTTLSYCTTEADGRIMPNMMYLHEGIADDLSNLIAMLQETGTKVSGQMTHCGHFSRNTELQRLEKPLGPSKQFVGIGASVGRLTAPAMTKDDINYLVGTYRDAGAFMKRVGFDAIEIHFGHGYGLSQFISPITNKRDDEYGGSHENRMRLPLEALAAVREAVGDEFPILGKISMTDGTKGGVDYDEGIEVAKSLDRAGIDALITSGGTSSHNTMLMFRGDSIGKGMIEMATSPVQKMIYRIISPLMWKDYPYEPTYFLEEAKRVKDAVSCPVVYIGGCSTRADLDHVFDAGFDFVQLGRALLKDPDFVKNAAADKNYDSGCIHCNRCVPLIEHPDGIRCVLNDKKTAA